MHGGLLYKRDGVLVSNFERKRKPYRRYQDPVLWVWLKIISPQRSPNPKTDTLTYPFRVNASDKDDCIEHHLIVKLIVKYLLSCFVQLKSLKGSTKAPAVEGVEVEHPGRNQNCFEPPNRYDEQPRPFYIGTPPPSPRVLVILQVDLRKDQLSSLHLAQR